ncbi:S9 family peptidase [Sphingomonas sp. KRR8]|uniref:alpha/beta hydrolase family protein n=1 Tax=Sphingomonas sp. KRR8 TaxID=2942996 RepID=UPI002020D473|nr:S9 family peptidase [Sphingomonas sp. KRR8]URD61164.1 S9 family peptidase [Sphingomonas sp. KRR8]
MIRTSLLAAAALAAIASPQVATARPMTATDMHMMHRLSLLDVSADGRTAVLSMSTTTDLAKNKRSNALYTLEIGRAGATPQPITGADGGHDAAFGPDGALYFLKADGDHDQLFRMPLGGTAKRISDFGADVSGFKLSPTGDRVLVWADTRDCPDLACSTVRFAGKEGGSGRTFDQLFVRHWDTWAEPGTRSRIFTFPIVGGKLTGQGVRVTAGLTGDAPSKPFGGGEEIDWSKDGRTVFFALREAGRIEPLSTNLDVFSAPADGSAPPTNLTDANDATDTLPTVSPDGRTLAWVAMARPGYESDRQVLMLRDLASGKVRALTQGWDRSVQSISWAPDGRSIYVTADDTLEAPIFRVDVASGRVARLTGEGHAGNVHALRNGSVLFTSNSIAAPDDLYLLRGRAKPTQLTNVNRELLSQLDPITVDRFSFTGANGEKVWGIKVKPKVAAGQTLPIAFVVHGGPQGSFGNGWSYRWNPRVFASMGYGVVSVDFHGSTGYGQAFTDSIRNNWGGWPLEDLQKGLAFATAQDKQLQADNACALGASYGGYMMNWIEGNWPDRFKCIVQHDGVFDARAMAYETEELWFDEWEHGGKAYYEDPAAFERWNPVNHVSAWKTPQLVITGEKDFRIPYTQGLAAFTALQRRNIPSRLVVFPDENHWVLKPQNSIQWYREVQNWMNKWAPAAGAAAAQ